MTVGRFDFDQTINSVARQLAENKEPETRHFQEARWIVQFVLRDHGFVSSFGEVLDYLNRDQIERIENLVKRRLHDNEPIAYLLGDVPFCGLDIKTRPPVLIPRMETEEWCLYLINKIKAQGLEELRMLDLCTGSGCIALALAKAFPKSTVLGIDVSDQALELAQENAKSCGLENVNFKKSDLFSELGQDQKFDLIVSNPPYIDEAEWRERLKPGVRDWEDKLALVAGDGGLEFYKKISSQSGQWLSADKLGWLIFEISADQSKSVSTILESNNFEVLEARTDSFGKDRSIFAVKKSIN